MSSEKIITISGHPKGYSDPNGQMIFKFDTAKSQVEFFYKRQPDAQAQKIELQKHEGYNSLKTIPVDLALKNNGSYEFFAANLNLYYTVGQSSVSAWEDESKPGLETYLLQQFQNSQKSEAHSYDCGYGSNVIQDGFIDLTGDCIPEKIKTNTVYSDTGTSFDASISFKPQSDVQFNGEIHHLSLLNPSNPHKISYTIDACNNIMLHYEMGGKIHHAPLEKAKVYEEYVASFGAHSYFNGKTDGALDAIEIRWKPEIHGPQDVRIESFVSGDTPDGQVLLGLNNVDLDGDRLPEILDVDRGLYAFANRSLAQANGYSQFPNGFDYSKRMDKENVRVGVLHSSNGQK